MTVIKIADGRWEEAYRASNEFGSENPDASTKTTWPEVARGQDAYAGGRPGDGGAGGTVTTYQPVPATVTGGPAGPPSPEVSGGEPGGPKDPVHLALQITFGKAMFIGRKDPAVLPATGALPAARGQKAPEVTADAGVAGSVVAQPRDRAWATPALVDAVLAFAGAAFRSGHRELAAERLAPLWAELGTAPDLPAELALRRPALSSLHDNLLADVDFYGNPPGWLPRLSLQTNLEVFDALEDATLSMLYYAGRMLDRFDRLEHATGLAEQAATATADQLTRGVKAVERASKDLEDARVEITGFGDRLAAIDRQVAELKGWCLDSARVSVETQQLFSGTMKIVGGVLSLAPVGQPFVGLVGGAVAAAGDLDWNDPAGVGAAVTRTAAAVGASVDKALANRDAATRSIAAGPAQRQRELAAEAAELTARTRTLTGSTAELTRTVGRLQSEVTASLPADATARQKALADRAGELAKKVTFSVGLKEKLADLTILTGDADDARALLLGQAKVQAGLAQLDAEQARLTAAEWAKPENAERKARLDEAQELLAGEKRALAPLDGEIRTKLAESKEAGDAATRRTEAAKAVLDRFNGLGAGLTAVGAGVGKLLTPVTDADPRVAALAEKLMTGERLVRYKQLLFDATTVGADQQRAMESFHRARTALAKHTAAAATAMATLDALVEQQQSAQPGLGIATRLALTAMKTRAVETMNWAIYNVVMSARYEFLRDAARGLFDVATFSDQLLKLTVTTTPGVTSVWDLAEADFVRACKKATDDRMRQIAVDLIGRRQHHGSSPYASEFRIHLTRDELDLLRRTGAVLVDPLAHDGVPVTRRTRNLRLLSVDVPALDLTPARPARGWSMALRVTHSGTSILYDGKRWLYFAQRRDDDPRSWGFVHTVEPRAGGRSRQATAADVHIPAQDEILNQLLRTDKPVVFADYHPGLYGRLLVRLDPDRTWEPTRLAALDDLALRFHYVYEG